MSQSPPPSESSANDISFSVITLGVILGLGGLLGLLLLIGYQRPLVQIADCRSTAAPLNDISGRLRRASQDYYLVSDEKWHLLHTRCTGKTRQACLAATANAEDWLEAHLGDPVSAHLCPQGIVDYTVAARQFRR